MKTLRIFELSCCINLAQNTEQCCILNHKSFAFSGAVKLSCQSTSVYFLIIVSLLLQKQHKILVFPTVIKIHHLGEI